MKTSTNKTKVKKAPWPTKAAMEQVYAMKLWGGSTSDFYSGDGSHNPDLVIPYIAVLSDFLKSFKSPITVCDMGCGDFNIGKALVNYTSKYVAVDIVSELIAYNKTNFKAPNLEFMCLDAAVDQLPAADCIILRQVLQHLSNAEILNIVAKLKGFKYVILTEHLPEGNFTPNKDIISGQGIRLKKKSGVDLLAPPFNLQVKAKEQVLSVKVKDGKGVVVTTIYTL